MRRYRGREFYHPVVEKREPPFHRMSHGHAIPLRGKNVPRKQKRGLQILRLRERVPAGELRGQVIPKLGDRIVPLQLLPELAAVEKAQRRRDTPARPMRIELVGGIFEVLPEKRLQIPCCPLETGQVRIQSLQ